MSWKFARLLEITLEHPYFEGVESPPFQVLPTDATRARLAAHKLIHRPTPAGAVVLFEVDPFDPEGALPLAPIQDSLELEFYVTATSPSFSAVTGFRPDRRPFASLTNDETVAEEDLVRLHPADTLGDDDLLPLKGYAFELDIESPNPTAEATLQGADGRIRQSATLETDGGITAWSVNLADAPAGRYALAIDGVAASELHVDVDLLRRNAVALLTLRATPLGNPDAAFIDEDGAPAFRHYLVRFPARATTWRYIVVTRDYDSLDETTLSIADTILDGDNPRYAFEASGPKAPLPSGEEAVIFASTSPIPILRSPISGLALRRAGANDGFSNIRENLPNPAPSELGQTSTPASPVSDIFVYI